MQDKNFFQDGNPRTFVDQLLVLLWAWYLFIPLMHTHTHRKKKYIFIYELCSNHVEINTTLG